MGLYFAIKRLSYIKHFNYVNFSTLTNYNKKALSMCRHIDRDHKFMAVPPYLPYINKVSHSDDNGVGRAGLVPLRDGGSKGCLRYFQPGNSALFSNGTKRFVPLNNIGCFYPLVSLSGNRALGCCSLQRFILYYYIHHLICCQAVRNFRIDFLNYI